jgi:thymidylate kinase
MALLDAMIHYAVVLRLARVRCGAVICDRYWRDGLLDLTLRFPDLAVDRWLLARCVSRLVPRPDVAILLSIPYEEMIGRMGEKAEPFPDPPQVRDRRYAEYMRWAASGEVSVVEAGEVREKVAETVMSLVRGVGR